MPDLQKSIFITESEGRLKEKEGEAGLDGPAPHNPGLLVLRLELQLYGGHHRQAHREGKHQVAGRSPVKFVTKEKCT